MDAVMNRDKVRAAAILASAGDLTKLSYKSFRDLLIGLTMLDYLAKDPQKSWDEQLALVAECLDTTVYASFAWAVSRRKQHAFVPLADALIERHQRSMADYLAQGHAITDLNPVTIKSLQYMYNSAISMHRNVSRSDPRALEFAKQIPPEIMNKGLLAAVTMVYADWGDGPGALAAIDSAVAAGTLEHRFESAVANRAVLEAFTQKNPDAAIVLLEEMIRLAPTMPKVSVPNGQLEHPVLVPYVLSGLMAYCSRHRKLDQAVKIADLAKQNGVAMDGLAVTSLVTLQHKMGNLEGALDLIYAHPELQPDMKLMTLAMDILGTLGDRDAAVGLYNAALEAHANPAIDITITQPFLTAVVRVLGRLSGFDAAVDAFLHLAGDLGIQPHPSAILHLTEDLDRGTLPPEHVARRLDEVRRIVGTVPLTEQLVARHIERYLARDDVDSAIDALLQLPKHNIPVTGTAWAILLNYMATHRDPVGFDQILALRPQLGSNWLKSTEDFLEAVFIKGYSRTGHDSKAIEVWDEILACSAIPGLQVQASILDACGFMGDLAVLQRVAAQIEASPWGGTNTNTWTSAVEAYLRVGRLDLALDVGQRILPLKHVQPDHKFWITLLTINAQSLRQFRDPGVLALLGNRQGGEQECGASVVAAAAITIAAIDKVTSASTTSAVTATEGRKSVVNISPSFPLPEITNSAATAPRSPPRQPPTSGAERMPYSKPKQMKSK
ncbi:hypothetical protein BC828DRAFT_407747 [Blastocladiella britannica]|nr:hypothetical protein BC828DRAFT_407747 [Blastocladiella britannica]